MYRRHIESTLSDSCRVLPGINASRNVMSWYFLLLHVE